MSVQSSRSRSDIAIIGVGFKGPGAENLEELWGVLKCGENHVGEIPKERWNVDAFYDPDSDSHGKYCTKMAGLLKKPFEFDNAFFNINHIESDQMDPQQKLVLECSYRAMEHAGITRDMLEGSRTGVYIGAMNCDYRGMFPVRSFGVSNYTVTGISNSIIAARVSYTFDLRGPCMVLDTGCSSALIAIHTASQAIELGECDTAFCGGVNFIATPDIFVHLSKAEMMSPTGQCHAFSELADGYARGEGCGIVILKKLSDAQRDNDRILAVIQTGTNQDGREVTPISAPSKSQQTQLLEDMYRDFSLEQLDEVEYIEAHGTGTQAGDLAEANALGEFFTKRGSCKKRIIGSVKTNIGHLESAAGVAGLIKVLLMMEHNKIVPSLFSDRLNHKIDFDKLKLVVSSRLLNWTSSKKVVSVNSFGFGGSNCHAIVRSHPPPAASKDTKKQYKDKTCIVCFSGKNFKSLQGCMTDFMNYPDIDSLNIVDISYTSTLRRTHYKFHKAFVVDNLKQLTEKLRSETQTDKTDECVRDLSVVFVFGGMGTSWEGMCREFLSESEIFRNVINEIDQSLKSYVSWSLLERLSKGTDWNDTLFSPLAIFACQVALAKLWLSLGVRPSYIVGQSVGEVAASFISGHLSLRDAVMIIYKRSLLLSKVAGGNMFIVRNMDMKKVKDVVGSNQGKANVSVEYSPLACAVSAQSDLVETIKNQLLEESNQQAVFTDLSVPTAFHSHRMDSIKSELKKEIMSINPRESPKFPVISTVTGHQILRPLDANYWADNLREPVRFYDAIKISYKSNSHNIYIEISPKPVLTAHIQDIFPENDDVETLTSMTPKGEWKQFLESVANIYSRGLNTDWTKLPHYSSQITTVPRYCFTPRKIFYKSEAALMSLAGINYLRLQHPFVYNINNCQWVVMISNSTFPSAYDHKISNMSIVPGAFYPEIGFALTKFHPEMKAPMYSVSAQFEQPFRLSADLATEFQIEYFTISDSSVSNTNSNYKILVKHDGTTYAVLELKAVKSKFNPSIENIQFIEGKCAMSVKKDEIYSLLKKYCFTYGPNYSLLQTAYKSKDLCLAQLTIPESLESELPGTTLHPSVIDGMIQATVILFDDSEEAKELFPRAIESLTCYSEINSKMYIIARRKRTVGNLTYYDVKLTSMNGKLIAEMKNLTHKTLSDQNETIDSFYCCRWIRRKTFTPTPTDTSSKVLFITDNLPKDTPSYLQSHCLVFDLMRQPWEVIATNASKFTSDYEVIVVSLVNCFIQDSEDGETVLEKTLNLCLFLQQLYNCVFNHRLRTPVFIYTKGAFALEDSSCPNETINPVMTSVWGLLRCALREPLHQEVTAIDLQVPLEQISLSYLASIAKLIHSDLELKKYPEFIARENHLYVNQILQVSQETKVPTYRLNYTDSSTSYLVLNNHPSTPDKTFNVIDNRSASTNIYGLSEIHISEAVISNSHLYQINLLHSEEIGSGSNNEDGFLIFSVEGRGDVFINETETRNVVFCYPTPVASRIKVPKEVVIGTELMQTYKPGDLTKLTVLLSLCQKIKTNTVTILTSVTTMHLAQCCQVILQTLNASIQVNQVQLENFNDTKDINETVLSLVLIDKGIIHRMSSVKEKLKHLVTVPFLMGDNACLFSVSFPSTVLELLDTKQLFSPSVLKTTVPQINAWINSHRSDAETVLQYIHEPDCKLQSCSTKVIDLKKLLEIETYKLSNGYLRAGKSDLFRKDSLYIVVGGLTGLGWVTVKYLAENGAGTVVIINRRTPDELQEQAISDVSLTNHCSVEVFNGDVTNLEVLDTVLKSICTRFPNQILRGVFFSAAVLEDKPLLEMTETEFLKVLSPKVKGAWNMHLITKKMNLDYFVMYSSVTSVVGNICQANYGAGNAFMDGLALYRRSMNLAGQSINWGALNVGMLEGNEVAKKVLQSKGFIIMSEEYIIQSMEPLLLLNLPLVMPCQLDEKILLQRRAADTPLRLQQRLESIFHTTSTETVQGQREILQQIHSVRDKPRDQRLQVFENYVCDLASLVLNLSKETLISESNLRDYGLDSIVTMTLINYIFQEIGCRLHPIMFLSGQATINRIAVEIDTLFCNGTLPAAKKLQVIIFKIIINKFVFVQLASLNKLVLNIVVFIFIFYNCID
ncbi:hypothetical protein Btru_015694 [Bulinus truncatus]|nr:hypothetical protein Btru_015694 [Bulinus truncatus]